MNNEPISSKSQTDWQHLDAMNNEDIDLSDCPEITPELFAKAVVKRDLPVAKNKAQPIQKRRVAGTMKGMFVLPLPDDFDEPLEL
jgi:hypothetical protein